MPALLIFTATPVVTDGNWAAAAGLKLAFCLVGRGSASAAGTSAEPARTKRVPAKTDLFIIKRYKTPKSISGNGEHLACHGTRCDFQRLMSRRSLPGG